MTYIRNGTQINDDGTYVDPTGQTGYSAALDQTNSARVATSKYGSTSGGLQYLIGNSDSELNAVNQQALWDREDQLRKLAEVREDTSMDRIVAAALPTV